MKSDNILADTANQNRFRRVRRILILMNIKTYLAFDQSHTNSESVLSLLYFQDDEIENQNEEFSFAERSESNKLDNNLIYRIRYFSYNE